jgi:hypothetical protein
MRHTFLLVWAGVIALAAICSYAPKASAQQIIKGTVMDSSGSVVPDAIVIVTQSSTGIKTTLKTDSVGLYGSPTLPLGQYSVQVSKPGFKTLDRTALSLDLGATLRVDFTLVPGSTTQTVEVTAAQEVLNTEDPSVSGTLESQAVAYLPLRDRTLGDLMGSLPGVYYTGTDNVSYGTPRYNIRGTGNVLIAVDGAGMALQQGRTGNNQLDISPTVDAIQEVQIDESYYGAQYGGHDGGMIRIETKSGGNRMHVSAYEFLRNEALDTRSYLATQRQPDNYNLFGGSLGGPIKKNRAFFFGNVEGTISTLPQSALFTFPTTAERSGDFSALGVPIYDPATTRPDPSNPSQYIRDPFPGNIIPTNRIDTVAAKVASYYPNVTQAGANNFAGTWNLSQSRAAWTLKLDYDISAKDRLSGTWLYTWVSLSTGGLPGFGDPAAQSQELTQTYRSQAFIVRETHQFSPTAMGSFRFDYARDPWQQLTPSYDPAKNWGTVLGLKNIYADWGFPIFSMSGYYPIGGGASQYPNGQNDTDYMADITLVRGRNIIKFGNQTTLSTDTRYNICSPAGAYNYVPSETAQPNVANTGDGFASFLLGATDSASMLVADTIDLREQYIATYVNDTIRVNHALTLNLGLRYEIDTPMYEARGNYLSNMNLAEINPVSGTPGVITFAGIDGYPTRFWNTDWLRFYPRLAFAYGLGAKTVIRGGYGIYGGNPKEKWANEGFDPVNANVQSVNNGLSPAFYLEGGFPAWTPGGTPATLTASFGAVPVGQAPNTSPTYQARNHPWGNSQNFVLSIQRQLPGQIAIEADGIGALGRHLNVELQRNEVPENLWGSTGNAQVLRPFPQFGGVEEQEAPVGITDYYGLDLKTNKRFSHGLLFLGDFTWQKVISQPGFDDSQYSGDLRLGRELGGYSNDGMPSMPPLKLFNFTGVYNLPFGGSKPKLLGGWSISGAARLYGGIPFSITNATNSLNCFCGAGYRLNLIQGGSLTSGTHTLQEWFNTSAVAGPAFGQLGNLGNTPRGLLAPDSRNLDLAIAKDVTFSDRYNLRFNLEIFNLTNTPKFGIPGNTFGAPGFGVISDYSGTSPFAAPPWAGARIMQVGVHFQM